MFPQADEPMRSDLNELSASGESEPPSESSGVSSGKRLRKEEIVAEATRMFAERGYEGTSMGDLATSVGLRKASLFHHFPSKDALYTTVLAQLIDTISKALAQAVMSPGTFAERLDALMIALTTALGEHPHAARILIREVMDAGAAMHAGLGDTLDQLLQLALTFTREGQNRGEFVGDCDPVHLLLSVVGMHFMPFVMGDLASRLAGTDLFGPEFVAQRKKAIATQVRMLVVAKKA